MNQNDYYYAGFHVFGLCGTHDDHGKLLEEKQQFKKPRISNWQLTQYHSEEQWDLINQTGHFTTGFGVLVAGYLIVDVDARNGGVTSYAALCDDLGIDLDNESGFIVETGSGGGSKHVYFKYGGNKPLRLSVDKYKGIDFKTTGYVVGAGSLHRSGALYEPLKGHPEDIEDAPEALVKLLVREDRFTARDRTVSVDVNEQELRDMLSHINPDIEQGDWLNIGTAIHNISGGELFDVWDEWSARGTKYGGRDDLVKRWEWMSNTKAVNPITIGTIIYFAEKGGWVAPATFDAFKEEITDYDIGEKPDLSIDVNRPPGLVGEVCQWINEQCIFPRESLAVAAALSAVSIIGTSQCRDELEGITPNLMMFCVAGSGTGKEAINKSFNALMKSVGMSASVYGGFKSDQEIYRNLLEHQVATYNIDELGIQLHKVIHGKADYLSAIIASLMLIFSKANDFAPITGDTRRDVQAKLMQELSAIEKKMEKGQTKELLDMEASITKQIKDLDSGIRAPFLSMMGYTTPVTFDDLFTFEQATNGFLSRTLIFREEETNPRRKRKGVNKRPVPEDLQARLWNLRHQGREVKKGGRIDLNEKKRVIKTTADAVAKLEEVEVYFHSLGEHLKEKNGLESLSRRGYEMTAKVSMVLATHTGVRDVSDVAWAFELVRRDMDRRVLLAQGNSAGTRNEQFAAKIIAKLKGLDEGETIGYGKLKNGSNHFKRDEASLQETLQSLIESGAIVEVEKVSPNNGKLSKHYRINQD